MKIRVEVVYALADAQTVIQVELGEDARVADALAAARLLSPEFDGAPSRFQIGIWGVPAAPDTRLRDRDRVEIYRELQVDPKQARRKRARLQRAPNARD